MGRAGAAWVVGRASGAVDGSGPLLGRGVFEFAEVVAGFVSASLVVESAVAGGFSCMRAIGLRDARLGKRIHFRNENMPLKFGRGMRHFRFGFSVFVSVSFSFFLAGGADLMVGALGISEAIDAAFELSAGPACLSFALALGNGSFAIPEATQWEKVDQRMLDERLRGAASSTGSWPD